MKKTLFLTALSLALAGAATAADVATKHHFVLDGPMTSPLVDAAVAAAPGGVWSSQLSYDTDTVSLHFQGVQLDEGESIVVAGSNPDQTFIFDAKSGPDFWTPVFDGGKVEILIENKDGGRTSIGVPEIVLGFHSMDSLGAARAKVASDYRNTLGAPSAEPAAGPINKIIYGADDRKEPYQISDEGLLNVAKSTCVVVFRYEITNNGNGTYTLSTSPYTSAGGSLCTSEPFYGQSTIGFCSGFLVGPRIVATAGHCVDANGGGGGAGSVSKTAFIFDFKMRGPGLQPLTTVSADNVYFPTSVRNQILSGDSDHSIVNLDREVVGRNPLPIRRTGTIANSTAVTLIGHPFTLPLKIAGGATVKNNRGNSVYFEANTDSYGGNSGSPVVNNSSYVVEGILVRGQTDYIFNGQCVVSNRVPDNGNSAWEEITKSTVWSQYVPTIAPTPTVVATPTPAPSNTPTPSISPTPSTTPTPSPIPTQSPLPTISPTPKPEVEFEFSGSTDNWTNASVSGFVAPTFSNGEGRLVISTTDNVNTFGYWTFTGLRITADGSTSGSDVGIIGTTGPNSLYRAKFRLSSNVANPILAPAVRLRSSSGSNEQTTELMVSSTTGLYSVTPAETEFIQVFSQPANQTRIRLAVDVLNIGGVDAVSADVRVGSVVIEALTKSVLTGEVKELDRPLGNDTEWTSSNAGGGYLPPVFERTVAGLSVRGTADATPTGIVIGYWRSALRKDVVTLQTGRIYRADFTLATTAPATLRSSLPTIRLRLNDSTGNSATLTNIESVNGSVQLPSSDGGPVVRSVYYVAPPELAGNYLRYSLDYIWTPALDNDPTIPVILQKLDVYSYDPIQ